MTTSFGWRTSESAQWALAKFALHIYTAETESSSARAATWLPLSPTPFALRVVFVLQPVLGLSLLGPLLPSALLLHDAVFRQDAVVVAVVQLRLPPLYVHYLVVRALPRLFITEASP